jgi:hypothetical protein
LEGTNLANFIRVIWRDKRLDRNTRISCTLNALGRLDYASKKGLAKALCLELTSAHTHNKWIQKVLSKHLERYAGVTAITLKDLDANQWSRWYTPGKGYECRLCGYRPPK